jgi:hypothetical protein
VALAITGGLADVSHICGNGGSGASCDTANGYNYEQPKIPFPVSALRFRMLQVLINKHFKLASTSNRKR